MNVCKNDTDTCVYKLPMLQQVKQFKHKPVVMAACLMASGFSMSTFAVSPLSDNQLQAQSVSLVPLTAAEKKRDLDCSELKKQKASKLTPEERNRCGIAQSDDESDDDSLTASTDNADAESDNKNGNTADSDDDSQNTTVASDDEAGNAENTQADGLSRDSEQSSANNAENEQLNSDGQDASGAGSENASDNSGMNQGGNNTQGTSAGSSNSTGNADDSLSGGSSSASGMGTDSVSAGGEGSISSNDGFNPSNLSDTISAEDQSMLGLGLGSGLADTNVTAGVAALDANVVSNDLLNSAIDFQNQQMMTSLNGAAGGSSLVLDEIALGELRKSPYTLLIEGNKDNGTSDSADLSYQGYDSYYIYESINGGGINRGDDLEIPSISAGPASVTIIGR